MKRYLITGSSGFVGSRLLRLLNNTECEISLILQKINLNYETAVCSLGRDKIPLSALKSVDTVFHLAGFAHDLNNPSKVEKIYQSVNVDATVELAELAVQSGVKKFIFVSSVKAGGGALSGECMTEIDQSSPDGVYGRTKREAEIKLLEIGRKSNMHVSIIRPALVYGPNAKGNLNLMLSGIELGWFPPLPEVGNRRSMIHVDDLVRAIFFLAEDDRANGEIFIATDGKPYSSREIYNSMRGILNKRPCNWSVPIFLFNIISLMSERLKYKIHKLLGDDCYSSNKLFNLGFRTKKSLDKMNKTSFR